jgi:hypothetical protein
LKAKNGGIAKMFGTKNNNLPWGQFVDKLEENDVSMRQQQSDTLADLLDCHDNKDMVDLKLFQ